MSTELMKAFGEFAGEYSQQLVRMAETINVLRAEVADLRNIRSAAGQPGERGERGQDGRGVESFSIRDGALFVRFSDGVEQNIGRVVGDDGKDGAAGPQGEAGPQGPKGDAGPQGEAGAIGPQGDAGVRGEQGIQGERGPQGDMGVRGEMGPRGEMGEPGPAGADGISSEDEIRRLAVEFVRAASVEHMRSWHRGVFKAGQSYEPGHGVTWDGSAWLATRATGSKPGTDDSWVLIVKRGRDGRDAR